MRKHYLFSCLACLISSLPICGQPSQSPDRFLNSISERLDYSKVNSDLLYAEESYEQLLACPEGTVQSVEFKEGGQVSQTAVDANRSDMKSIFYQYYDGCMQNIQKIRLMASFSTFDGEVWSQCSDHPILNENAEVIKELPLEIGFYEKGADGRPGKELYHKTISAQGKFTQIYLGRYAVYEFLVDLKETISLYKGFFSVRAAETPNTTQTCWFSILGSSYNPWKSYVFTASEPEEWQWVTPFSGAMFCLIGDGSYISQHAVELKRIISPVDNYNNKKQKVQVEVGNIGEQPVNEINLELWFDGKLLATENIKETLNSGDSYKYTFNQRIDCSDNKEHTLEIRNVTPNIDQIVENSISLNIKPNDYPKVGSIYSQNESSYISSVEIGNIVNSNTGNDSYHDYSDMKTPIHPKEKLVLTIKVDGQYTPEGFGVWVDWNNNKSFKDEDDLIILNNFNETTHQASVVIEMPKDADVAEGDVRLRITACCIEDTPSFEGEYLWGETEDYTLTITRNPDSPILVLDKDYLEVDQVAGKKEDMTLSLSNEGKSEMTGNIQVDYILPNSPNTFPVTEQLKAPQPSENNPKLKIKSIPVVKSVVPETTDAEFVLKYDFGQSSAIGMPGYQETSYATYYPGEMLKHIQGMTIESVDVYIYDPATTQKVIIYGEGTQKTCGKVLAEQEFTPTAYQWNTIKLNNPVTIGNSDLWISVKFEGISDNTYPIGTDRGNATEGFGGLLNIGGTRWWSLPELDDPTNLCIRANVYGTRTDAINWISLDKSQYNIQAAGQETLTATLGANQLNNETLYEAIIRISSNDELNKEVRIPVYMTCLTPDGIEQNITDNLKISCQNHQLTIDSEKEIDHINILNMAGQQIIQSNEHIVNLMNIQNGIYIIAIQFTDNTQTCVKVIFE